MLTTAIATITAILASSAFIWTASIILLIAMAISLEIEREGWTTTFFSLGIALFLWNFRSEIWEYLTANPAATIGFIVTYVLIGIAWSFIKWRSYVMGVFNKFKEYRKDFVHKNGIITPTNIRQFNEKISGKFKDSNGYSVQIYGDESLEESVKKITPIASNKKTVITSWISYWPVSVTATLLNNPFRHFFEWIYSNLSGYYDKITNRYKKDALGF